MTRTSCMPAPRGCQYRKITCTKMLLSPLLVIFILITLAESANYPSTTRQLNNVDNKQHNRDSNSKLKRNYPQTWRSAGLESDSLMIESYDKEKVNRVPNACPEQCRCGQVTGITCYSQSNNSPLPTDLPPHTRVLTLYGYKIIEEELVKLTNLEKLNIYDGDVVTIPSLPKTLTHLDIINSNLKSTENIHKLSFLQSLNLAYNNLTEANFMELSHLTSLDLSHNPIERIPDLPTSLAVLNLKRTPLSRQPTTWEVYLPNLKRLVMTGTLMSFPPYMNLPKLEFLDLSHSHFKLLPYLSSLPNLKEVDLSHTELYNAIPNHFKGPTNLRKVDLSFTRISNLPDKLFLHNPHMKEIYMHHTKINYIKDYTFSGLAELEILMLNNNPNLTNVDDISLRTLHKLKTLDISHTPVMLLPYSLINTTINTLNIKNNTLICDCHSYWLPEYLETVKNKTVIGINPMTCSDGIMRTPDELEIFISSLKCAKPIITSVAELTLRRGVGKTALLECNSTGLPNPIIVWHSPDKKYYMYNHTDIRPWFSDKFKYIIDHLTDENLRIKPLKSGQLLIQNLTRADVGLYRCTAVSAVGSVTVTTFLWLTTTEMVSFEIETLLFGLACAMTFLLTTLIVQLIRFIMDRMGWECCCCRGRISYKAQQVKKLLETVESYRSQQLDRLRDNYNCQVVSIKESCYQQMERLSESYTQQCKNIQNLKDYSAQGINTVRDQYVDQINKVRDYSVGQMNRVSENYVFQRQRVRKFSAHQMFKLRETYKYQQKTLNKILENIPDLYLQNCRTGGNCNRTDSIIFDDEIHGIDAYYRLEFLNPMMPSFEGSQDGYFTPSSTLTKTQRQHIIQQHKRQYSNGSTTISNNDYHEAFQSWATNTPNVSPNTSPSHLTTSEPGVHNSRHKALKHTKSLINTNSPTGQQQSHHRRTHSATINPPIKVTHCKTSPILPEKGYWLPPKSSMRANVDEFKDPKTSDCEGSDNENTAMLKKSLNDDIKEQENRAKLYTELVPIMYSSDKNRFENNEIPFIKSLPRSVNNDTSNKLYPTIRIENNDVQSEELQEKCENNKPKNQETVSKNSVSDSSANKEETNDTVINNSCSGNNLKDVLNKRKSLSREGSKEIDGRFVLSSVNEDTEPTASTSTKSQ